MKTISEGQFEFVEFEVGESKLGLPIAHVKEIIQPVDVTIIPHAHPFVEGIIQLRGEILPVINMEKVLESKLESNNEKHKFIVIEMSGKSVVFHVHEVSQIHRIRPQEIEKSSELYEGQVFPISGVVKMEDRMILLIDFEVFLEELLSEV